MIRLATVGQKSFKSYQQPTSTSFPLFSTMKHLATTTSLPFVQHDRKISAKGVVFSDALINHNEYLQLFDNALAAKTATLVEAVRTTRADFEEALSNANTKEERETVRNREGKRNGKARKKLNAAATEVYKTFATKAGLSTKEIDAVELLCTMNGSERAKIPTQQQLVTLLGDSLSEETKSALSDYNKAKTPEAKCYAKAEFTYYLTMDMAGEVGRKATNENAKALAAKLADDYNKKYWQTKKGRNADRSKSSAAVAHREWFIPSFIRQMAPAFNQLVIVDTVDENDEEIKEMSKLLDDIESAEGDERNQKINDFWTKKS